PGSRIGADWPALLGQRRPAPEQRANSRGQCAGRQSERPFPPPRPPWPSSGPGGPILVVADPAHPYGRYYGEILRAEGLNAFLVSEVSSLSVDLLSSYDVVILGEMPLAPEQ